jgi:DNA-binding transcriptional LysR family regulator
MNLELRPLRSFLAVARLGSFTRAAQEMGLTQPTLSAQIIELELDLGFDLFARSTRRVALTREGVRLRPQAQRMVDEADRLKCFANNLKARGAKELRIGAAYYTQEIPERVQLIEGFAAEHPEVSVRVDNSFQSELVRELVRDELELAFFIGMPAPASRFAHGSPGELLFPSDFKRLRFRREPLGLLIPKESNLTQYDSVPLAALRGSQVALLARYHGIAMMDSVRALIERAGAKTIAPPEGSDVAVERYARRHRVPALTTGWFHHNKESQADMVRRPLNGIGMFTELVLLRSPRRLRAAAVTFWNFAARAPVLNSRGASL